MTSVRCHCITALLHDLATTKRSVRSLCNFDSQPGLFTGRHPLTDVWWFFDDAHEPQRIDSIEKELTTGDAVMESYVAFYQRVSVRVAWMTV